MVNLKEIDFGNVFVGKIIIDSNIEKLKIFIIKNDVKTTNMFLKYYLKNIKI